MYGMSLTEEEMRGSKLGRDRLKVGTCLLLEVSSTKEMLEPLGQKEAIQPVFKSRSVRL